MSIKTATLRCERDVTFIKGGIRDGRRLAALAFAIFVVSVTESESQAVPRENAVVTFGDLVDSSSAYFQGRSGGYIHGGLDLQVELRSQNTNTLCFSYSIEPGVETFAPVSPTPTATAPNLNSKMVALLMEPEAAAIRKSLEGLGNTLDKSAAALEKLWGHCYDSNPASGKQAQASELNSTDLKLTDYGAVDAFQSAPRILVAARAWLRSVQGNAPADSNEAAIKSIESIEQAVTDKLRTVTLDIQSAHALHDLKIKFSQYYPPGKAVTVRVKRQRLARGQADKNATVQSFDGPVFYTLSPIWFDTGFGPGLTFRRKVDYDYAARAGDTGAELAIVRTSHELNLDGVVFLSIYYCPRWLDEAKWRLSAIIPRPALGLSMSQPLTSLYLGAQIDPFQFVDITAGWRWFSETTLVSQRVGDPALLKPDKSPFPLGKTKQTRGAFFLSVSASTDLFVGWLKKL